jgi:hypothetical protein
MQAMRQRIGGPTAGRAARALGQLVLLVLALLVLAPSGFP